MNPYTAYYPSGIEWLGEIPEHWETKRLKVVASINDDSLSEHEDPLRPISYVDISSIDATFGITEMEETVFEDAPSRARRLVCNGDTIVSTVRTYLRAIAPVLAPPPEMVVSTGFAVIRPRALDPGFASWVLREQGLVEEIVACSTGVSYPAINASRIGDLPVPLPSLDEQRAIAAYLDHETEHIDTLVAKMRLLFERLEEYRAALITRIVTGGLWEEAALKPSGIEWLGEIPEHWETKRLKIVASTNDDTLSEHEDPLRPIAYVDIGSVDSTIGITEMEETVFEDAPSRARRLVCNGDTIVSTVRTYLRAIAPVLAPPPEMVVSTGFAVIRPRALDPGFASWVLREQGLVEEIVARSTGVSYPAINASRIGDLPVPLPSLDEQRAIAAYLDHETDRIRTVSHRVETAIERLQEYRAALITAAVTGKIDLRGTITGLVHPTGKSPSCA